MNYRILLMMVVMLFVARESFSQAVPAQAVTNITIHHSDGSTIESGTIVWRGNRIEQVGTNLTIPFDAKIIDGGDSLHVYPGFIDGYSYAGSPDRPSFSGSVPHPGQPTYKRAGIVPDQKPHLKIAENSDAYSSWKKQGFTTAAIGLKGHFLTGSIDIFSLQNSNTKDHVLKRSIAQGAAFQATGGVYPNTLMGMMAQLRQLLYDAEALEAHQNLYASNQTKFDFPGHDTVLEALYPVMKKEKPFFFQADNRQDIMRIQKLSEELGFNFVLVSGNEAWKAKDLLRSNNIPVLVSFDLPEKPDWMKEEEENEDEAESESELSEEALAFQERQKDAWEANMRNVAKLLEEGVQVGFASLDLGTNDFAKNAQKLLEYGVSNEQLLQILTVNTANILGIQSNHGAIRTGYSANFMITSGPAFDEDTKVMSIISHGNLSNY